jgi:hypothetical protein
MDNPIVFFLLESNYFPMFSIFFNLLLLLVMFGSCVYKKRLGWENSDAFTNERFKDMSLTYNKLVVICCETLSALNSVLLLLSCFNLHKNGWDRSELMILLDLLFTALSWGAISFYIRSQFTYSHDQKFPILLRVWWVLYFMFSCYRLLVDIALYKKQELVSVHLLLSDVLAVSVGLFLCYSCLQKQGQGERINLLLEEPLLNGAESSAATSVQLDKAEDDEVVTPFSNAGFLSHVSFSWMSPLIVLGNEKIIDSEDVPQVDNSDRAEKLFWIFRSKLEWADGERRITTYKLIKALFFSVWRDILLSTLFAFVYTVSCYVAPYLMDTCLTNQFSVIDLVQKPWARINCSFCCNVFSYAGKYSLGKVGREVSGKFNGV